MPKLDKSLNKRIHDDKFLDSRRRPSTPKNKISEHAENEYHALVNEIRLSTKSKNSKSRKSSNGNVLASKENVANNNFKPPPIPPPISPPIPPPISPQIPPPISENYCFQETKRPALKRAMARRRSHDRTAPSTIPFGLPRRSIEQKKELIDDDDIDDDVIDDDDSVDNGQVFERKIKTMYGPLPRPSMNICTNKSNSAIPNEVKNNQYLSDSDSDLDSDSEKKTSHDDIQLRPYDTATDISDDDIIILIKKVLKNAIRHSSDLENILRLILKKKSHNQVNSVSSQRQNYKESERTFANSDQHKTMNDPLGSSAKHSPEPSFNHNGKNVQHAKYYWCVDENEKLYYYYNMTNMRPSVPVGLLHRPMSNHHPNCVPIFMPVGIMQHVNIPHQHIYFPNGYTGLNAQNLPGTY